MTIDPASFQLDSSEFAAAMTGIIADLGLHESEHPWSVVPPLAHSAEPNNGICVQGLGTIYIGQEDIEKTMVEIADRLQDHVIDVTWQAVPTCLAGHSHPMQACLVDAKAVWTCPRTGETVRTIAATR